MDADEKRIADILQRVRMRSEPDRTECLSEERLAIFLKGSIADDARTQTEAHLAVCPYCLEEVIAAYKSGDDYGSASVPQRLMAKAMALVSERENLLDLAVRLVEDSLELISTTARVLPVPVPVLRGEPSGNTLQVEQEVGRFRVAVELDLTATGTCQVVANVKEISGAPAEGVRLSLSSGDREQSSFLTRHGLVVFDQIAPGEYSIAVSEAGTYLGKIRLNLMLEK